MTNEKIAKFIIDVSAKKKRTQMSNVRFFSMDHKTAKIVVQAEKDGETIAKTSISRVEIMFESLDTGHQPNGKVIFNDQMTVDNDGLFSYLLKDELLNYGGILAFEVYIYYLNQDISDSSNRIIYEQRVSAADRNAGQVELVYIKDMETAKEDVNKSAEEIKAEIENLYDTVAQTSTDEITKITAVLPQVQSVATDEIGKIRDVISTVDHVAQEVNEHADQKIAEYDAKFVSTDQKMAELEQSQGELDAELKVTQQQIADADVYTKAETDVNTSIILDARNLSPAWSWSEDGTDRFTTVYPNENLLSQSNTIEKKWINSDGTIIALANGFISDFLPVMVGEAYTLTQVETEPTVGVVAVYDSNKQYISRSYGNNGSVYKFSIDVVNAAFMRIAEKSSTGKLKEGIKLEHGNVQTIYTPAPSDDPLNAYPIYKGLRLAPSDNPADYDWSYTDEYVDYLVSNSVSKTEFNDLASRFAAFENQGGI